MTRLTSILIISACLAGIPAVLSAAPPQDTARRAPAKPWQHLNAKQLKLKSQVALVVDRFGNEWFAKEADEPTPIASITKLMTAMVLLDSHLPLDEPVTISKDDRDALRLTGSRLRYGATLTRAEMLTLALMSSENRAAAALARTFPGGETEFVRRMNLKARTLGLTRTRFTDPTGLDAGNVSTARELARIVRAAHRYPKIREATTRSSQDVRPYKNRGPLHYVNTNRLVRGDSWHIELSKTGYINEAGRCLVMVSEIRGQSLVLVLLNSYGKLTPIGDANRVRRWIEQAMDKTPQVATGKDRPRS